MANFKNALNLTINEMAAQADEGCFCCAVYWDDNTDANAIIMFMDYGDIYPNMHAVMKDLHSRLSEKMGHPVAICHNHPTDESVLIHSDPSDADVYYSDECCRKDTIECYERWNDNGRGDGYRPEIRSLFFAAECLAKGLNKTPIDILEALDWNEDPQAQMIQQLVNFHN